MRFVRDALKKRRQQPEAETSQEMRVLKEAVLFRRLAALAWDRQTIYPQSEYIEGKSNGQCGVTNFGFGLWLCQFGIVYPYDMVFEEGRIVDASGSPVGHNHTWLRVDNVDDGFTRPNLCMRFDLAGDQFSGIDVPEVVQYDDYFYPDPHTSSGNRVYEPDKATPFLDYDTSRFAGRLIRFMYNVREVSSADHSPLNRKL